MNDLDRRAATALLMDYLHENPEEIIELDEKHAKESDLKVIVDAHNYAISVKARGKGEKYDGQVICESAVKS